jgi:hypothetical protein
VANGRNSNTEQVRNPWGSFCGVQVCLWERWSFCVIIDLEQGLDVSLAANPVGSYLRIDKGG